MAVDLRRIALDWLIGWHSGQRARHDRIAAKHYRAEERRRAEYDEHYPPMFKPRQG